MNPEALALAIKDLDYVVMRNWEKMPPDGDIDFFVSLKDKEELREICDIYLRDTRWYDIFTFGDNYYTKEIEDFMLLDRRQFGDWWIPSPEAHFFSLYHHNAVHKGDGRYDKRLRELYWEYANPSEPNDKGVGYHDPRQLYDISKN